MRRSMKNFVAGLFVMALCAFSVAALELYEMYDYAQHGRQATMELAYPDRKLILFDDAVGVRTLDVKYVGADGEILVPQKVVPANLVDRLIGGEKIPVTYFSNNLQRAYFPSFPSPNPWVWLIVAVISTVVAGYAFRLFKRESQIRASFSDLD